MMSQIFFQIIRPVHVHLKTDKVDLKNKATVKSGFFLHFFAENHTFLSTYKKYIHISYKILILYLL